VRLNILRLCLICAVAAGCAQLPSDTGSAAEGYRVFALELLQAKPAGTVIRSDLEVHLDGLAAQARQAAGRPPLVASDLLRDAARAQALEMLQGNYVGHQSKSGYRFKHRFAAFADPDVHGSHGENAARDRQAGPVDRAKALRLFQQWIDSTGHRRNLMNRTYRFVSTGAVEHGHHLYAVQIFWER
jgi:uncharacterized protein YkwD